MTKTSKTTKAKREKATTKPWRSKYSATAKVRLLVRDNPHRAGTKDHAKWAGLRSGRTVRALVEAGTEASYLRYLEQRGLVAIK